MAISASRLSAVQSLPKKANMSVANDDGPRTTDYGQASNSRAMPKPPETQSVASPLRA